MLYYSFKQFMLQQQERLDQERTPTPALSSIEVIAVPTGKTYPHNKYPGPLDGMPENHWHCKAVYEDGSTKVWK
jgi:hypothetical protein